MITQVPICLKIDLDNLSDVDNLCKLQHPSGIKLNRNKIINYFIRWCIDLCTLQSDLDNDFPYFLKNIGKKYIPFS